MRLGLGDDAYYAALDRGAYSTADEIVEEMVTVSLGHGVQCAYTSFLTLLPEDRHRLDPRDSQAVAVALKRARERTGRRPLASGEDRYEVEEEALEEPILMDSETAVAGESRRPAWKGRGGEADPRARGVPRRTRVGSDARASAEAGRGAQHPARDAAASGRGRSRNPVVKVTCDFRRRPAKSHDTVSSPTRPSRRVTARRAPAKLPF